MQHRNLATKVFDAINFFKLPFLVLLGIILSQVLRYFFQLDMHSSVILLMVIAIGCFGLVKDTLKSIFAGKLALDYIAILAITVALTSGQYLVAAVIVLMLSGGRTLEVYGTSRAKQSLTALVDRIPSSVFLWENGHIGERVEIATVAAGDSIAVRRGEVIPLDGVLISKGGFADESSLTGEPFMIEKIEGDVIRSGTVNSGEVMAIRVTKVEKDSTYKKIVDMVREAQEHKAPFVRLADRYSNIFTVVTLILAGVSYLISHDFGRVLSVLVIATPCPLILATPIALMGGMSSAAKKRIIIKRLSSIEVLSKVNAVVFDKTGTITLGKPFMKKVKIIESSYKIEQIYGIAEAIERNSLHPLAKAIVDAARAKKHALLHATDIREVVGSGISGEVNNKRYELSKIKDYSGMAIQLVSGGKQIAVFEFEEKIKSKSGDIIANLKRLGLALYIFTGDKKEAAYEVVKKLGQSVTVKGRMSPEDKKNGLLELKSQGKVIAMVGDGINDAPALALADVGMVFSNDEQTAASDAADIVFLGGEFESVTTVLSIGDRTIRIALESILFGIGLSTVGMVFAVLGFIPPISGAFLQEAIDIAVIFNALRASI